MQVGRHASTVVRNRRSRDANNSPIAEIIEYFRRRVRRSEAMRQARDFGGCGLTAATGELGATQVANVAGVEWFVRT